MVGGVKTGSFTSSRFTADNNNNNNHDDEKIIKIKCVGVAGNHDICMSARARVTL